MSMSQTAGPSTVAHNQFINTSFDLVQCPLCPNSKTFKGQRGLQIHKGRAHKQTLNTPTDSQINQNQSPCSSLPLWELISKLKQNKPLISRIPRGARISVAKALSLTIQDVVNKNDFNSWKQLLTFLYRTLHVEKDTHGNSLTQKIKYNCTNFDEVLFQIDRLEVNRNPYNLIKKIEKKVSIVT